MKVFMIRHGESETNKNGLWTGWLDPPLTEKGREGAESVGRLLSGISFDKIYSSDLSRAKNTAEIALKTCEYEVVSALREINVGNISGKPLDTVTASERETLGKDGYGCFGGESQAAFGKRVLEFMRMLEREGYENVAVFSHAGFIRKMLDSVLRVKVPHRNMLSKNCMVAIFEYNVGGWKLHSWINI